MDDENETGKTTTITIPKNDRYDGRVPVAVNGQISHIAIDTPTPVGEHILEALNNAGVEYFESSPKGKEDASESGVGSEASTVISVHNDHPIEDEVADADPADPPPVLNEEALVQTPAPTATAAAADGTTETPAITPPAVTAKQEDAKAEKPLTVAELTEKAAKISDVAQIDALLADEKAGKKRATAIAALEARKAELAAA